ncbi:MAG: phosphoribosylaminoimidazolesuccinocarboxamide synthase, partial [Thermoanaerobaculia bacterium]
MSEPVWKTEIPDLPPPRRGKVRDVYDLGDLLM